jgi:stalled ribosome rescue protein Dom34
MNIHYHVIVWIDHQQAKIFEVTMDHAERAVLHSTHAHQHLHHKANAGDSGHAPVDTAFLKGVATALSSAGAILVTGPANAKTELVAYIKAEHPELFKKISGVEALDHPTDGALVAFARRYFKADDRMHSPTPFS